MRNRRRIITFSIFLMIVLFLAIRPAQVDSTLISAVIEEPWLARNILANPAVWASQARCRYQQRKSGQTAYTIACVCSNAHRISNGAGFWSTMPGCLTTGRPANSPRP